MKRILLLALVLSMTLGIAGVANASLITTTDLGNNEVSMTSTLSIQKYFRGSGTFKWSLDVTPDFTVPYDIVNSASLKIDGYYITSNNNLIRIEQTVRLGSLATPTAESVAAGNFYSFTVFDLTSFFIAGWGPSNGTFDVKLAYNQPGSILLINSSTLTIDYTNVPAPAPEPGTMMLLGSGLVGLAVWGRKKISK